MRISSQYGRLLRGDPPLRSLLVVALCALAVYAAAPWNGWAIDDVVIAAHPLLQSVRTLPHAVVSPWWYPTQHLYRPLTTGAIGVELLLDGGAPWLPHAINILLHALAAVLVTRLCRRWLPPTASIAAGLTFAFLPAHGEAVATLVAQAELLAAVFLLAMLLVVTRDGPPTRRAQVVVGLLSAAALASKEGGVAAPVLALGAAWAYPGARQHAWRWSAAALAGTVVMLVARFAVLGELGGDVPHVVFRTLSAAQRIPLALSLLPSSAEMLFLPMRPAINYSPPLAEVLAPGTIRVVVGAVLVLIALGALALHVRRPSPWTLGFLIISATLVPTTNLLFASGVVLSGRSVYAPSIGAAMLVGAVIAWLLSTRLRHAALVATACYLAACALLTMTEARVWRSSATAIDAAAERGPDSYWVPMTRGYRARDAGRTGEALLQFRTAAELLPFDTEMLTDGAALALAQRDTAAATRWLRTAIAMNPRARRARARLMSVLVARRDTAEVRRLLEEGVLVEPDQRIWAEMLARAR